jgi:glycosyltransferase involved in cell wall biosynthesis
MFCGGWESGAGEVEEMNVAFLANSFHINKTKSVDFLLDLLREAFGGVTIIPHKEAWARLPGKKWDLLVVFQKRYPHEELEAFGADRVVLVPMYDDTPLDEPFWKHYLKFKVLCFSSTMVPLLRSYGICALGVRYYPELPRRTADFGSSAGLRGFFWPRIRSLDWSCIRRLIGETAFSWMHIHWTPEVHGDLSAPIVDDERFAGKLSTTSWSGDRTEYQDRLADSNVFFASRTAEGIGNSFLEAMAMGLCVVAPNAPTMNEYIQHGVNGLLYDHREPAPLDFSRAKELGAAARSSSEIGRQEWLGSAPAIRSFLEEPLPAYHPRVHPVLRIKGRSIARARKVYRFLKRVAGKGPQNP